MFWNTTVPTSWWGWYRTRSWRCSLPRRWWWARCCRHTSGWKWLLWQGVQPGFLLLAMCEYRSAWKERLDSSPTPGTCKNVFTHLRPLSACFMRRWPDVHVLLARTNAERGHADLWCQILIKPYLPVRLCFFCGTVYIQMSMSSQNNKGDLLTRSLKTLISVWKSASVLNLQI